MSRDAGVRWRVGVAAVFLALVACDPQRIEGLEEGVSTEAQVRQRFGEPAAVYPEEGGARTLEYPRQPEGQTNYMITISADGRLQALRQVLKPADFETIRPGLDKAEVRRRLGRPAKVQPYPLKNEEVWTWRWREGQEAKLFLVTFDADGRTTVSQVAPDLRQESPGMN